MRCEGNRVQRGVVRPEGFEPPTLWFEAKCSIQLSYGRVCLRKCTSGEGWVPSDVRRRIVKGWVRD